MRHDLTIKKRYVSSDRLFAEINEFIESGLRTPGIPWTTEQHRASFAEVVGDWLDEFQKEGKITQFKLVSDERINPKSQSMNIFNVTVSYKQTHCVNTTIIEYVCLESDEDDPKDLLSYILYP